MIPNRIEHSIPVIYLITNIVNGKIYVGSAKNFYSRYRIYVNRTRVKPRRAIEHGMAKWGFDYFVFSILEEVGDKARLVEREQHYIDALRSFDISVGYNMCPKARSTEGRKTSPETRRKISEASKDKGMAVVQIDPLTLSVINEYPTALSAARACGRLPSGILATCRGQRVTAGGYLWAFKDGYSPLTYQPRSRKAKGGPQGKAAKPIMQMDQEGNDLRLWDSAPAAGKGLNVHPDCIRAACYGRVKVAHGYRWKFITDETVVTEVNERRKAEWRTKHGVAIR